MSTSFQLLNMSVHASCKQTSTFQSKNTTGTSADLQSNTGMGLARMPLDGEHRQPWCHIACYGCIAGVRPHRLQCQATAGGRAAGAELAPQQADRRAVLGMLGLPPILATAACLTWPGVLLLARITRNEGDADH